MDDEILRNLRGTEVHVYKVGRLYTKASIIAPKRPCTVEIRGRSLTICQGEQRRTKSYDLAHATLYKHTAQNRIVLQLVTKEKLALFAENANEFCDWIEALTDSLEWRIQRFYEIGRELGRGAYAVVRKGRHRATGDVVAVKIISKGACSPENLKYLQREIDVAKSLKHKNIVRTSDIFESGNHLYIVLELLVGGTLQNMVDTYGPLSENDARYVMLDLLSAVQFIHQKGIVHRDIKSILFCDDGATHFMRTESTVHFTQKPENMMCTGKMPPMTVKIMDFGLSRLTQDCKLSNGDVWEDDSSLGPDGLMTTPVGTPSFVAPEITMSLPYGKEVDMFACGVVMYWLLCGYLPFQHEDPCKLMEQIRRVDYSFPEREWERISKEAKELIAGMLDGSPYARTSADVALAHPWIMYCQKSGVERKKTQRADDPLEREGTSEMETGSEDSGSPRGVQQQEMPCQERGGDPTDAPSLTDVHSLSF